MNRLKINFSYEIIRCFVWTLLLKNVFMNSIISKVNLYYLLKQNSFSLSYWQNINLL
jgi:hypothetical protein